MSPLRDFVLINPEDLHWRPSNLMKIPNADYLERTGSENLGARLWRLPPKSANTLHKHVRAEEFYFVVEGMGRIRIGDTTLTVPRHGGVWVPPNALRQVFNDTDRETLWLIIGGPEELEFLLGSKSKMDLSLIYPTDPTQLPRELNGVTWPPPDEPASSAASDRSPLDFTTLAHAWIAAWNAHDLETILSHYAETVEFKSPFVTKLLGVADATLRGKVALRDYFSRGLAAYPNLHFTLIRVYSGVAHCVLEYESVQGLRASEVMEFDRGGKIERVLASYA